MTNMVGPAILFPCTPCARGNPLTKPISPSGFDLRIIDFILPHHSLLHTNASGPAKLTPKWVRFVPPIIRPHPPRARLAHPTIPLSDHHSLTLPTATHPRTPILSPPP